ncbi:MAG: hypothetical protein AAF567_24515 [Actinomycetota bacterium]
MNRENPAGVAKLYYFTPAQWDGFADLAALTVANIESGTDITGAAETEELAERSGWKPQASTVDTPGMASKPISNIPGRSTKGVGMLRYYSDPTETTIRSLLNVGKDGGLVYCPHGVTVGYGYEATSFEVMTNTFDEVGETAAQTYTVECSQGLTISGTVA